MPPVYICMFLILWKRENDQPAWNPLKNLELKGWIQPIEERITENETSTQIKTEKKKEYQTQLTETHGAMLMH